MILRVRAAFEKLPKELGIQIIDGSRERLCIHADKESPLYKKLLDNLAREYKKYQILLSYEIYMKPVFGKIMVAISISIKQGKTMRVKPTRFVYHYSLEENRTAILTNGLELRTTDKWGASLAYEPAIFATQAGKDSFYGINKGYDQWAIDTTKIKNIWWSDLNFFYGHEKEPSHVMTYESIPTTALTLYAADQEEYYNQEDID